MLLWVFWFCFDDALAAHLGVPALGTMPFWVVFLLSMGLSVPSYVSRSQ